MGSFSFVRPFFHTSCTGGFLFFAFLTKQKKMIFPGACLKLRSEYSFLFHDFYSFFTQKVDAGSWLFLFLYLSLSGTITFSFGIRIGRRRG